MRTHSNNILSVIIFVLLGLSSCDKEVNITGDAGFLVINEINSEVTIYFDSDNIGKVDANDSRNWGVPSGSHKIKAKCSGLKNYEETLDFIKGRTTKLTLTEDSKAKTITVDQTNQIYLP
jgi:hypothetical protein